jgi:hypothetical protein
MLAVLRLAQSKLAAMSETSLVRRLAVPFQAQKFKHTRTLDHALPLKVDHIWRDEWCVLQRF